MLKVLYKGSVWARYLLDVITRISLFCYGFMEMAPYEYHVVYMWYNNSVIIGTNVKNSVVAHVSIELKMPILQAILHAILET